MGKVYTDAVLERVSDADFFNIMSSIGAFPDCMRDTITVDDMIFNYERTSFINSVNRFYGQLGKAEVMR